MKFLSVDVGGTFIKHAAISDSAEIIRQGKIPTPKTNRADFFAAIEKLYRADNFAGIGISLPGIIDAERGVCVASVALPYNNGCNIVAELEKICGTRVAIENDANCAALAEAKIGSLADVSDGFVMVFGTSIGGAFIKNHKIHRGKNNLAGEIAFTSSGEKIFHDVGSVPALLKMYAQIKNLSSEITGENFFRAVDEKENDALFCLDKFARRIAEKIFDIQMVIDAEKFAIGGGISAQKSFIAAIRLNLAKIYDERPINFPSVEVVPCRFRNDANLIGAFLVARA